MVTIEIDGKKIEVEQGSMIIEAADREGITIPRFCYHKKLSIAANCRMCLVEVENAPKPLPACATPVAEGMKVQTRSKQALYAQKSVMEFLLINHPLDCPVCDQGGECELQDIAMGYGSDISQYSEAKRAVKEKNLGSLISTDMTRCIHCTRCVRFGTEVAGLRELGATGRGEHMEIGTFIEQSVTSELSGNVIDICPVGALNSKPFRFKARSWDLRQYPAVSAHDCVGANMYVHTYHQEAIRVVPRENEAVNEVWISDRDRFSYQGLNHEERLQTPMIKVDGKWEETDWATAFEVAGTRLKSLVDEKGANELTGLISPNATTEEHYLFQKLLRGLGVHNIDHRLRETDFSDQAHQPLYPEFQTTLASLEHVTDALLIGSNIAHDQPLVAHRIRKAVRHGSRLSVINSVDFDFNIDVTHKIITPASDVVTPVAAVAKCVAEAKNIADDAVNKLLSSVTVTDEAKAIAQQIIEGEQVEILLGQHALMHPAAAQIRFLAKFIAQHAGAKFGVLSDGANSAGAAIAGTLPHRGPCASDVTAGGSWVDACRKPTQGFVLFGFEPDLDVANSQDMINALSQANTVVALTAYRTDTLLEHANVLLPIAPFSETSGTFVNIDGLWQSFKGSAAPLGETRPGWKVLRVLGNVFTLDGFDYMSSEDVLAELKQQFDEMSAFNPTAAPCPEHLSKPREGLTRLAPVGMYASDAIVRRAEALQKTVHAQQNKVYVNETEAKRLGFKDSDMVKVVQNGHTATLPLAIDSRVPDFTAMVISGIRETACLGAPFGAIEIQRG